SLAEMRAAAEYHGGAVGRASGQELLAFFTAHEDDPLRAARAALQMRRALRSVDERVDVRTAAATGRIHMRQGLSDADGHAVVLARRLAASAEESEILLDAATVEAAGAALDTEAVAPLHVRGEAAPVAARRLLDAVSGPMPRASGTAPMVGRAGELE